MDGRGGNDLLIGGGNTGGDTLQGGAGNDTLNGGAGTADIAKYNAPMSQFTIERFEDTNGQVTGTAHSTVSPSYYYKVTHLIPDNLGGLGTDTLFNIEKIQFTDPSPLSLNPTSVTGGSFWVGSDVYDTANKFLGSIFQMCRIPKPVT
jgi:Ca2+-binding RTX toxin-like protein